MRNWNKFILYSSEKTVESLHRGSLRGLGHFLSKRNHHRAFNKCRSAVSTSLGHFNSPSTHQTTSGRDFHNPSWRIVSQFCLSFFPTFNISAKSDASVCALRLSSESKSSMCLGVERVSFSHMKIVVKPHLTSQTSRIQQRSNVGQHPSRHRNHMRLSSNPATLMDQALRLAFFFLNDSASTPWFWIRWFSKQVPQDYLSNETHGKHEYVRSVSLRRRSGRE